MIANIQNQNFGYSVAVDSIWAAVGNPSLLEYDPLTSSLIRTGSVEIFKYNINTDTHDLKIILYRSISNLETIFLTTEYPGYTASTSSIYIGPDSILHTEYTGTVPFTSDLDIIVDSGIYFTASGDGYGICVDIRGDILAVGCPSFSSSFNTYNTQSYTFVGSGSVDIFDLSKLNIDPYAPRISPTIISSSFVGGFALFNVSVSAGQNYRYIFLQSKNIGDPDSDYQTIVVGNTSNLGGTISLQTNYTSSDLSNINIRILGIIGTDPYSTTIYNPNPLVTESFGKSVSINDEWLAIGSPLESGSLGSVFLYRKEGGFGGNPESWSLYQNIIPPPGEVYFGHAVALNKATGSYSGSLAVGTLKPSSSYVYEYEFDGTNWNYMFTLKPDNLTEYPLTFYPILPIFSGSFPNTADSFGFDIGFYQDTIIVGAPTDRSIYEYSGSQVYQQGAVYFFQRCSNPSIGYYIARKSYGNENIMKNNMLGYSVSIYDQYAVAGIPKVNSESASICYLQGSLFQNNFCGNEDEETLNGQYALYNKTIGTLPDTSFIDWNITNIYQTKKKYLSPYRTFGWDIDISSQFIIVGSPMLIYGNNTVMSFSSGSESNLDKIDDLSGKSYIYNLRNLRPNFYVGNVFYRNGKVVIMTSGSNFEGLLLSNVDSTSYEYDMNFTSKLVVFEKQIVCAVDVGEFNVSTNPTAIVMPTASFDINQNGKFDFEDVDVLLKYMMYKSTEVTGYPKTDWSSSIIDTTTNEESSVYNMYNAQWGSGSSALFTSSYSYINNNFSQALDFNQDNKINSYDMNILWKYFINRLNQKNYDTYITPNSQRKFLSDILDFINQKTMKGIPPSINPNFLDYNTLSQEDPTGSYLSSYVTTIGLYSGCDLVCVAKLGSPIKITPDFPMNFVVKMDF